LCEASYIGTLAKFWLGRGLEPRYIVPGQKRNVLLCGSARSGTTWLKDIVNFANQYCYTDEPFNCDRVKICAHFSDRQYLRPDDNDIRFLAPAYVCLAGGIRSRWIDRSKREAIAKPLLIKDVRSNLMLKWIRNHFPGMPIVMLVRHPCAVAVSKIKLGWTIDLEHAYLSQKDLVADHLSGFLHVIRGADNDFEKHIIAWCIETRVPFTQLERGDVHIVFYESLYSAPEIELPKLFRHINQPFDSLALTHLTRPSATDYNNKCDVSAMSARDGRINLWRRHVSLAELASADRILKVFGLDQVYDETYMPNYEKAESLLVQTPQQV